MISIHSQVVLSILPNLCVLAAIGTTYLLTLSTHWKWSPPSWAGFCLAIGLTLITGAILRDTQLSSKKNLQEQNKEVLIDAPIEHRNCVSPRNFEGLLYRVRGTGTREGVVRYGSIGSYRKCLRDSGVPSWLLKSRVGT